MSLTVAIIAPGAMGSAVGQCLTARGARVLTLVEGRSERTATRAREAGMIPVKAPDIAAADLIFSIVPPVEAVNVAASLATVLCQSLSKPVFIDFNAINPKTMQEVTKTLAETGCEVLDGAIIGAPPVPDGDGPTFYVSGDTHHRTDILSALGLRVRRIDGPVGAVSALKMVYAGINKGLIALGTSMLLASARAGCTESLCQELAESRPAILALFKHAIPDMYPKAYRWVGEMREIANFLGSEDPAAPLFAGAAEIFARMAEDRKMSGELATILNHALDLNGRSELHRNHSPEA